MWERNTRQTYSSTPPRWSIRWIDAHGVQHRESLHGESVASVRRDALLAEGLCAWIVDTWKEA